MKLLSVVFSLALAGAHASLSLAAEGRPNFVFIYTDDQRWDALGVVQREQGNRARFPWLKTPHLDRLAGEGVRFRNAFVVNSLCAPSRATFLTGCYGHTNGIVNNHTPFPVDSVTYASLLRGAGYRTGYVGKWHMGRQSGQRPGFDFSASYLGQGVFFDCPIEVNGTATPSSGWVDDVATQYSIDFIKENKNRPFALVLGFKSAHGPFDPPPRHKETYAGEAARAVPNLSSRAIYRPEGARKPDAQAETVPVNLNYFRCLTAIDENVGKVLQALDELKLAENTMVIFASDNGYYLGEHGLGDKRSAYDESLRIPLLIRYPKLGQKGQVQDQMVLNIDLAPTLLDYAGIEAPKSMHGRSWRPLLEGKATPWRDAFFYCYFYETGFPTIPTVTAVRTEKAKLIKYPGHDEWTEVFDLESDPYEVKNLRRDPAAADLRRKLEAAYEQQAKAIDFRIPDFADDPKKDEPRAPLNAWVLDYRFDRDDGDKVVDASGKNNHGTARGASPAEGRNGGKARRFNGQVHIEVPKSASLDPAVRGWTIEVTCKPESPDGVILARGGNQQGYCLHLNKGRPVFTVATRNQASRVIAREPVGNEWTQITARITTNRQLVLSVNGKEVARGRLHDFIRRDPNDAMQIGADTGSAVVDGQQLSRFVGLIEQVRLFSGEAPP